MKLTIGIPTYNGAKHIHETLEAVINQVSKEMSSQVDILISDNGSTDGTQAVIEKFIINSHITIEYIRNSENIGYDKNINQLFEKSKSEYLWTLADDDVPVAGAVKKILNTINNYKPDIIILNFDAYDQKLLNKMHSMQLPPQIHCTNPNDFFKNSHGRYGQVSSLITRRTRWVLANVEDAFGTNYVHVYAVYKIMIAGTAEILGEPFIKVRLGSENFGTDGDSLLSIATSGVKLIHLMNSIGYEKKIIKGLLKESESYVLNTVKISKRIGIKDKSKAVNNLLQAYNSPKIWIRYISLIYMPDFIYNFFKKNK